MATSTAEPATTYPPLLKNEGEIPSVGVPYVFSNEQFFQMVEADVLPPDARVFLWEGRVFEKMAKKKSHEVAGAKFLRELARLLPQGWFVNFESSVAAGPGNVPLPDLILLRGLPDDHADQPYSAAEVGLLIELSFTSLRSDLGPKMRGYAQAGFPNYWVADLVHGEIIEHRDPLPDEGRYDSVKTYARGESIPLLLDDMELGPIAINDLLPRP